MNPASGVYTPSSRRSSAAACVAVNTCDGQAWSARVRSAAVAASAQRGCTAGGPAGPSRGSTGDEDMVSGPAGPTRRPDSPGEARAVSPTLVLLPECTGGWGLSLIHI